MSEKEPNFKINYGETDYEFTRGNSALYTYMGKLALDHAWLVVEPDGEQPGGIRFFRDFFNDGEFDIVVNFMLQHGFESHLNLRNVPQDDEDAFIQSNSRDTDTIPDDWLA